MIVISAKNLTKEYDGTNLVLDRVSFSMNEGDRVGIIGINGAGKTTLLKVLSGELPCEEGDFFVSRETKIGYLQQDAGFESENTIIEEVNKIFEVFPAMEKEMADILVRVEQLPPESQEVERLLERHAMLHDRFEYMGGYSYRSEIKGILASMAFDETTYNKKISTLSGGEKTRLALACLLLEKPDILFLDEPTNHLDIGTLKWLEQYLKGYRGTIVVVSHDRYFLDQTVNRIFEIDNHKLNIYEGNYSFYARERKARREVEMRAYEKQQKEIARQEEIIRRFKQHGTEHLTKRAASRERMLEHMDVLERPDGEHSKMKLNFKASFQSGKDVLQAEELSKAVGYGQNRKELFENVALDIKRGERVCIVGANGTGKTTLLRMLMGELSANTGWIKVGHNVQFGYYDQGQLLLNPNNTVIEELQDAYRLYSDGELRNLLGRFLFRGEQVFLEVGALSGGEKARLSLLKLMMSGANTLILDEPTNHLDIESKEIFEEALLNFPGTSIIVSHDRYFLNKIPTRIMELTENGLVNYLGKYDYYVEKKQELISSGKQYLKQMAKNATFVPGTNVTSAEERRLKKQQEAEERRLARRKEALEKTIAETEEKISELEAELGREEIMTDHEKLAEISGQLDECRKVLDEAYEEWLELQE